MILLLFFDLNNALFSKTIVAFILTGKKPPSHQVITTQTFFFQVIEQIRTPLHKARIAFLDARLRRYIKY
jgi:hypothetical protein